MASSPSLSAKSAPKLVSRRNIMPARLPNQISRMSDRMPDKGPDGVSKSMSNAVSKGMSGRMADRIPKTTWEYMSVTMSNEKPGYMLAKNRNHIK